MSTTTTTSTSFFTGKGMAELFIPALMGTGIVIFKGMIIDGELIDSIPMYIKMGTAMGAFFVTDVAGDLLGATEIYDDGTFGKTLEAMVLEPILLGVLYGGITNMLIPFSGSFMGKFYESALMYASARFLSDPIIKMVASSTP
jgi:hypothetical protein